jgi:hypothetical protein
MECVPAFDATKVKNISLQRQSPFFGKLPREIREMMYTYALSGEWLAIAIVNEDTRNGRFKIAWPAAQRPLSFSGSCRLA